MSSSTASSSSSSQSSSPEAPAAVMNREKRTTAGKRMTELVGKAQEEDDEFWNHETWAEEGSGNESFHDSDEDSSLKKDEFDSDFDDSETDNEDEEAQAGRDEERDLQLEERRRNKQRKSNNYSEISRGGRALMQKAKGTKGTRRAMGDGLNSGIVLNFPTPLATTTSSTPTIPPTSSSTTPAAAPPSTAIHPSSPSHKTTRSNGAVHRQPSLAFARERRSQTRKRETRNLTPTYSDTAATTTASHHHHSHQRKGKANNVAGTRKSKRRRYTQEELLVEAVQDTEPENHRWLLARKRVQETADQDKDAMAALRDKHRGKNVIQKYHSRRGCLITLTFPEMDAIPEILTRSTRQQQQLQQQLPTNKQAALICAVTGKPAKYRDPKTQKGYCDVAAFKELRRRLAAGEPLEQFAKSKPQQEPSLKEESTDGQTDGSTLAAVLENSTTDSSKAATTIVSPKSPGSSTGFFVDLGGPSTKSPNSTRSSARKWKPSEKMLQGYKSTSSTPPKEGTSTMKVLDSAPPMPSMTSSHATSEPDSNSTTPLTQPMSTSNAPLSEPGKSMPSTLPNDDESTNGVTPKTKTTKCDNTTSDPKLVIPSISPTPARVTSSTSVTKQPSGRTRTTSKSNKPRNNSASTVCGPKKGNSAPIVQSVAPTTLTTTTTTTKLAVPSSPPEKSTTTTSGDESGIQSSEQSSPTGGKALQSHREQIFVIPPDADNGIKEPRYVTQSELIMQAINNYSQHRREDHVPTTTALSQQQQQQQQPQQRQQQQQQRLQQQKNLPQATEPVSSSQPKTAK